jgi:hypothetical protein
MGLAMGNKTLKHLMAAGVLAALATLSACGGGSGSSQSGGGGSTSSGEVAVPQPAPGGARDGALDGAGRKVAGGAARTVVSLASVIRTGEVTLTAKDLATVRADVDSLMAALGGTIANEQTTNDRHGRVERSLLVLRVPVDRFEAAKKALMGMGKLEASDESAKDVTTEVIDVNERVQTLQNSLDDLQSYQRHAKDVSDLLDFEEKITTRQAELQSLKAQQAYLTDQTSMSTITLTMSTPHTYVPPPDALKDAGFLSGLEAGWNALGDFVVVVLTVLGALLPFLVAGVLVGIPAWFGLRAMLRRRHLTTPPPALPDSP